MKVNTWNAIIITGVVVFLSLAFLYIAKPNLFGNKGDDKLNSALTEIEELKKQYQAGLDSVKANLPSKELSLSELYEANKNATLYLWNEVDDRSGSGFFISEDGVLITNYHVVENTRLNDWLVTNPAGYTYRLSKIVAGDSIVDYAILQIREPGFDVEYLEIEDGEVTIGQKCFAIGSPYREKFTLSEGVVSQLRVFGEARYIQNSAQIAPGSSGGPLFSQSGKVIGITTGIRPDNFGNLNQADINYAVDIKELNLSRAGNFRSGINSSPLVDNDRDDFKENARRALLDYMKLYHGLLDNGDVDAVEPMFAYKLQRFNSRSEISKSEVINAIKRGIRFIKNSSTSILPESFNIDVTNQKVKLTYSLNYAFINNFDLLSVYVLDVVVEFDEEGNISSIWEENVRELN